MKQFNKITLSILLMLCKISFASLPDSITIFDKAWGLHSSYQYKYVLINNGKDFALYQTYQRLQKREETPNETNTREKLGAVSIEKINTLLKALEDQNFSVLQFESFGYNEQWIKQHIDTIFSYVKENREHWSKEQIDFVKKQLSVYANYQDAIRRAVGHEGYSDGAVDGGGTFEATIHYRDKAIKWTAAERPFGIPWTTGSSRSYNPAIPNIFSEILPAGQASSKSWFRTDRIIPLLAHQIFDDKCDHEINTISTSQFQPQIDKLKKKYQVLSAMEYRRTDGYIDRLETYQIVLHDSTMLSNVLIDLYLSCKNNTLFTRDSILKKSDGMVKSVQSIPFIKNFLLENPSSKLKIKFEDDVSVNSKVIEHFNTTPEQWKQFDQIAQFFKNAEDLKGLMRNSCGCNFRIDNNFLKQGIYFEISDAVRNSYSTWVLLPDTTIILWWIQGEGFSKYSIKDLEADGPVIHYVCRKFNQNGELEK